VWSVDIAPDTPAVPHTLTREEVFVVLSGTATLRFDGMPGIATTGVAIVVPAGVPSELANESDAVLMLLCCMPVGGQACLADGTVMVPPWAQ
jgi:quercetin dioxygenase-like cupin family protein